ncbi:MAG: ATP-grasp domain-containing protein [Spirochaetaceae bacterium]
MSRYGILVLGAGIMQVPALEAARRNGWYLVVADGNAAAHGRGLADAFHVVDLKDVDGLLSLARGYYEAGRLHGVFTAGTDFSASVAYVSEALGLPGIPYERALDATDKIRMRRVFAAAGIPSPRFCEVGGVQDLDAIDVPPLPVVVKPVDNMGARGVRRVDHEAGLREAVADAVKFSRSGRAIVEEFIEGPEFSIDALVTDGELHVCGIADRHIRFPPYFIEVGHTMPTVYGEREQREVSEALAAAARALGIRNGAAKGDIFLTERGAMVGEVAARLSGGYMSGWTYPYASGVPLTEAGMRIALGLDPGDLSPRRRWTSAERASVSIPGRVQEVVGLDVARKTARIEEVFERCGPGDVVVFPRNNTEKSANVISAAPSREEAISAAEEAVARIVVRLVPGEERTRDFLEDPGLPSANELTLRANLAALRTMPDERPPSACRAYRPLPAVSAEPGRDWNYRTITDTLSMLEELAGLRVARDGEPAHGRAFWQALLKGGLQGALFYFDTVDKGCAVSADGAPWR